MFKINYSINGVKKYLYPDPVWWGKHGVTVLAAAAVAVLLFLLAGCSGGTSTVVAASQTCFPIVLEGNVDMPNHEDRIIARNKELVAHGYGISGDEARDNAVGGGGAPDGGMWLAGSYHFEIDANGQQIPDKSWLKLFSDTEYPVTGGVTANCDIAMGSIGGVDIRGKITDGKSTGKVMHGDSKVWIFGNMVGVAR